MAKYLETLAIEKLEDRLLQECPFCKEHQIIMMRGVCIDIEDSSIQVTHDKGYSFCNCRNIFYTNWKNIDQTIYDSDYQHKYKTKNLITVAENQVKEVFPKIHNLKKDAKTFLEIGSIHDIILDYAKDKGMETVGIEISKRESKHKLINYNIEDIQISSFTGKQDIIWATHVLEHLKDPAAALNNFKRSMADDGILYIAMPDTKYINWSNPMNFDWWVLEHHILWNRDDFIIFAEEQGLKCIFKERGIDLYKQEGGWFWLQEQRTAFVKA